MRFGIDYRILGEALRVTITRSGNQAATAQFGLILQLQNPVTDDCASWEAG